MHKQAAASCVCVATHNSLPETTSCVLGLVGLTLTSSHREAYPITKSSRGCNATGSILHCMLQTIASELNPGDRGSSPWLTAELAAFDPGSLLANLALISRGLRRDRAREGDHRRLRHRRECPSSRRPH
ncbi:uncharacterized protein BO72DRAFT_131136 [Aspergillus fijiensis CBS 313.89]|uniref:Uncharacterized protein n=1 Tax=Aspergillus fijiensis CBS 313.89 TaxID=1448319 RepID=A0A8G1RQN8_9EURO|nr:uncharacterized protein BO72DRAFT_131136 [Aspergillus fijiensis CBS 313.89]RAK76553.1 hypothetical protein BO72DRAFT_131136 [Aspergillus fijiensis CBS 313.89]